MSLPPSKTTKRTAQLFTVGIIGLLIIGYMAWATLTPGRSIAAATQAIAPAVPKTVSLAWPSYGQSALGVADTSMILSNGDQSAKPIASIAKTILALALLKQKPIAAGSDGDTITFTDADIELYKAQLAQNGSVVPINTGEQLTETQALDALLLPSGNNIADSLAVWGFGSNDAYLKYANDFVATLGMTKTHLADASGFSPDTVSTATDLVHLGEAILKEPVLAKVVATQEADLPVVGKVENLNALLGTNDVVGIKTGNTDQAGGCLLVASQGTTANGGATIVTALMGAPDLSTVIQDTRHLLETNRANFQPVSVVKAGDVVATYHSAWGAQTEAIATQNLTVYSPLGQTVTVAVNANVIKRSTASSASVGTLSATVGDNTQTVPISLKTKIAAPGFFWKLLHPGQG